MYFDIDSAELVWFGFVDLHFEIVSNVEVEFTFVVGHDSEVVAAEEEGVAADELGVLHSGG